MIANHPLEPYDSPIYYPFWQAASELGMPISLHIITSTKKQSLGSFTGSGTITLQIEYVFETQCSLALMLMGGVLERYPEAAADFDRERYRLDAVFPVPARPQLRTWAPRRAICRRLSPANTRAANCGRPSRTIPCGVALYKLFGEDNFMWASDFPHSDSTWPNSQAVIAQNFASIPQPVLQKIVADNAARLYGIELN